MIVIGHIGINLCYRSESVHDHRKIHSDCVVFWLGILFEMKFGAILRRTITNITRTNKILGCSTTQTNEIIEAEASKPHIVNNEMIDKEGTNWKRASAEKKKVRKEKQGN